MSWILLLAVSLALSFMLSGLESAVIAVSRVRVRHTASEGDRRAARLLPLVEDRDALLGALTVTNHLTNLIGFFTIAWKCAQLHGQWGYVTAFIISLPIFLIGVEMLPKKLFRRYPFRILRALTPLVIVVGFIRPLFRVLRGNHSTDSISIPGDSKGRTDLYQQAASLQRQGQLTLGAYRLIQRILEYRKLRTADIMKPLTRSVALSEDLPIATAQILAREHSLNILPVLGENGEFVGVLDLATLPGKLPPDRLVRHHMRTLDTFHAHDSAFLTLQRLRKRGRSLALVINDDKTPIGFSSEEDLLRHLLGI